MTNRAAFFSLAAMTASCSKMSRTAHAARHVRQGTVVVAADRELLGQPLVELLQLASRSGNGTEIPRDEVERLCCTATVSAFELEP